MLAKCLWVAPFRRSHFVAIVAELPGAATLAVSLRLAAGADRPRRSAACSRDSAWSRAAAAQNYAARRSGKCSHAHSGAKWVLSSVLILEKIPRPPTLKSPARPRACGLILR